MAVDIAISLDITIDQNPIEIVKVEDERFIAKIVKINKKIHEKELSHFFHENNIHYKELLMGPKSHEKYSAIVEFFTKVSFILIKEDLDKAVSINKKQKVKMFTIKRKKSCKIKEAYNNSFPSEEVHLLHKKRDSKYFKIILG